MGSAVCSAAQPFLIEPNKKLATASTAKTMNKIFAMPAAPAAIPLNPSTAAINAMTKKTTA